MRRVLIVSIVFASLAVATGAPMRAGARQASPIASPADPTGTAGLVLLDPPYSGYFDTFLALAPPGSAELEPDAQAYNRENEELLDVATGFRQVAVPAAATVPVVVVTHGVGDPPPCFPCSASFPAAELEAAWQTGHADLASALGARLVLAEGTSHFIADENPALVIGLVSEMIAAVRDPDSWIPSAATPSA